MNIELWPRFIDSAPCFSLNLIWAKLTLQIITQTNTDLCLALAVAIAGLSKHFKRLTNEHIDLRDKKVS